MISPFVIILNVKIITYIFHNVKAILLYTFYFLYSKTT